MSKSNLPKSSAPDEAGVAPRRRMTGRERREQLLEEAVRLFAEKGYDGASVEEIAHRANVSKPVVYEHFGGKEGIYAVVIDRELQRLMLIVESTIGDPLFQQNRLMAHVLPKLISALFEYVEERANGFRVLIDAPLSGSVAHQETVVSVIAYKVEEVLSAAGWAGEIARTYAQATSGMLVHSAAEWLTRRLVQRTEIVDHLIDIALHGVALIDEPWSRPDVADLVIYTSADDGSAIRDAMLDLLEIAGWGRGQARVPTARLVVPTVVDPRGRTPAR